MPGLRIFRTPKNQQFDYKPRYWDPKKEEMEERRRQLEELRSGGVEGVKARISSGFRRGGGYGTDTRLRQRQVMRSNVILIGVVVMLLVISYLLLQVYLPQIEEFLQ